MTLVEVLVALTLLSSALAATLPLIGRIGALVRTATDRDAAERIATSTIEQAKAYGCGLARGDESESVIARIHSKCWGAYGDSEWTVSSMDTSFTVTLQTAWTQIGAGATACVDPNSASDRPRPLLAAADGLERTVEVRWARQTLKVDDFESVPPDAVAYRDTSRGALLLEGAAGAIAWVAVGSQPLPRRIGGDGCAFFPFLPAGQVTWSTGAARGTASVLPETITREPDGTTIS
jgi:type II secretory pathway pseudopilin PulG